MSSFLKGAISPSLFSIDLTDAPVDPSRMKRHEVEHLLSETAFTDTDASLDALQPGIVRFGWVTGFAESPDFGNLEGWSLEDGTIFVRLIVAEKKLKGAEVKRRLKPLLDEWKAAHDRKNVPSAIKRDLKETVEIQLAAKTAPTVRSVGLFWSGTRVTIDSQASWAIDAARLHFRRTFGASLQLQGWRDRIVGEADLIEDITEESFASESLDRLWREQADVRVWSAHVGEEVSLFAQGSATLEGIGGQTKIKSERIPEPEVLACKEQNKVFTELGFHLVSVDDIHIEGVVRAPDLGLKSVKLPSESLGEDDGVQGLLLDRMNLLEHALSAIGGLASHCARAWEKA